MSTLLVLALLAGVDLSGLDALQSGYKFAEAAKLAEQLRQRPGLSRSELVRIVAAQAIAAGHLRQSAEAEGFFVELLLLEPTFTLGDEQPPRVSTPFLAARRRALEAGALTLTMTPAFDSGETRLRFEVTGPRTLAETVRVHVKTPAGWEERRLRRDAAVVALAQPSVEWWAELLGPREAQCVVVGSEAAPRIVTAPPASPPLTAVVVVPSEPLPEPRPVWSPLKTASLVTLGVGVVAAGVGFGFGQASAHSFETVTRARRVDDVIVGITFVQAQSAVLQGRTEAWVANGLFIVAGVSALLAGLLWLVS